MKPIPGTYALLAVLLTANAADLSPGSFSPTIANSSTPPGPVPEGMVWIPGGEFSMGANGECSGVSCCSPSTVSDCRPIHPVSVDGFWMDASEVTNAQFAKFVDATGNVTVAEIAPTKEEFPTAPPENLVAGSVSGA
jgi:sulfatase modifying factor 1